MGGGVLVSEVCDGCFLECERDGRHPWPCNEGLRRFARERRYGGAPLVRVADGRWERTGDGDDGRDDHRADVPHGK